MRNLLRKRAGLYTTSTRSRWDAVQSSRESVGAVVRFVHTVTAHAVRTAIKVGRINWIKGALAPVPVL